MQAGHVIAYIARTCRALLCSHVSCLAAGQEVMGNCIVMQGQGYELDTERLMSYVAVVLD